MVVAILHLADLTDHLLVTVTIVLVLATVRLYTQMTRHVQCLYLADLNDHCPCAGHCNYCPCAGHCEIVHADNHFWDSNNSAEAYFRPWQSQPTLASMDTSQKLGQIACQIG